MHRNASQMLHVISGLTDPCTGENGWVKIIGNIRSRDRRWQRERIPPSPLDSLISVNLEPNSCRLSPQAWARIRAQGLVISSGLGEQNESRHTITLASAPTGCDSQLPAAGQTAHSWASASGWAGGGVASPSKPSQPPDASHPSGSVHFAADQTWPCPEPSSSECFQGGRLHSLHASWGPESGKSR